jgi:hypothetical protein
MQMLVTVSVPSVRPRTRRPILFVTPATLMRWHREPRRALTYPDTARVSSRRSAVGPGVRRGHRGHRPRQHRHQPHRRRRLPATCRSGSWSRPAWWRCSRSSRPPSSAARPSARPGFACVLEVDLTKEVIEVRSAWRGGAVPNPDEGDPCRHPLRRVRRVRTAQRRPDLRPGPRLARHPVRTYGLAGLVNATPGGRMLTQYQQPVMDGSCLPWPPGWECLGGPRRGWVVGV